MLRHFLGKTLGITLDARRDRIISMTNGAGGVAAFFALTLEWRARSNTKNRVRTQLLLSIESKYCCTSASVKSLVLSK